MEDALGLWVDNAGAIPNIRSDRTVLLARLQEAALAQRAVRCVYFGGSKVGAGFDIIPIKIDPPDIWAHCVASGRSKRFRLGLLYILEPGEDPRWARPLEERTVAVRRISARNVQTLSQVIEECGDTLDALGWRIVLSERAIALHRITEDADGVVVALRQRDEGHWVVESLDNRPIKRRALGAAANIFLAAAERNARRATSTLQEAKRRANPRTILGFASAAAFAFAFGAILGVLLPR